MPRAWAHKGERLVHAFEAVAEATVDGSMHLDMRDQALMLAGMAIEVLLKALIVHSPKARKVVSGPEPRTAGSERRLWRAFYRHTLVDLAREARITPSEEQIDTAAILSQFIYWRGRYVAPRDKGIDDLLPVKHKNSLVGPPDRDVTIEAARRLLEHVIGNVKAGLYGGA